MPKSLTDFGRDLRQREQAKVTRRLASRDAERPGMEQSADTTTVTSALTEERHPDIPALMDLYRLDPEEWFADEPLISRWEGQMKGPDGDVVITALWQFKVKFHARKAPTFTWPDIPWRWQPPAPRPVKDVGKPYLILVASDQQIPFHDEQLHELSLRFAHDNKIDEWGDLGDIHDLDRFSKHRRKPEWTASAQETINTTARLFKERSDAMPAHAKKWYIGGNHDVRMRNWLLDHAPELFGLTRASLDGAPLPSVLDLGYLSRLDEMGWDHARSPYGEYPYEEQLIAADPPLLGGHGNFASNIAGASVMKELVRRHGVSYMQGHCNKQAIVTLARDDQYGNPVLVFGAEVGMMGQVAGGMGFSPPGRNWQQGFCVVTVWPSGGWVIEPIPYINGELRWRGNVWGLPAQRRRVA